MRFNDGGWRRPALKQCFGSKRQMKLTQFKTRASNQQRLGVAVGDVVCDVAELAQALEAAGAGPASWLLEAKDMLDVIGRGESALGEISALLIGGQTRHTRRQAVGDSLVEIESLSAQYSSHIPAMWLDHV